MDANLAVELLRRQGWRAPVDGNKEPLGAGNGRSLVQILFLLGGNDIRFGASQSNGRVR